MDNTISPAHPILASTLLSREKSQSKHIWRTGIRSFDTSESLPADTWSGGKIIGIIDDTDTNSTDNTYTSPTRTPWPVPLTTQLLVEHLASLHNIIQNPNTSSSSPFSLNSAIIYIITPPATTTTPSSPLSPTSLATALENSSPPLPATLLDSISLLQYLDLTGLADAVSEVSDSLSKTPPSTHQPFPVILILDDILPTLSTMLGKSSPVTANALLAPLLRSLTLLSRNRTDVLVLVTLDPDLEFLELLSNNGDGERGGGGEGYLAMGAFSSYAEERQERKKKRGEKSRGRGEAAVMNVLASTLDEVVLVHWVDRRQVLEVVMDRIGGGMGSWDVR